MEEEFKQEEKPKIEQKDPKNKLFIYTSFNKFFISPS